MTTCQDILIGLPSSAAPSPQVPCLLDWTKHERLLCRSGLSVSHLYALVPVTSSNPAVHALVPATSSNPAVSSTPPSVGRHPASSQRLLVCCIGTCLRRWTRMDTSAFHISGSCWASGAYLGFEGASTHIAAATPSSLSLVLWSSASLQLCFQGGGTGFGSVQLCVHLRQGGVGRRHLHYILLQLCLLCRHEASEGQHM